MPSTETHPDLIIDEDAATYAREKGGVLTIRPRPRHGCCGGRVDVATVTTDLPNKSTAYTQWEQHDLTVYVHSSFSVLSETPIHVGLDRLWIWASLYVEGADPQMCGAE